MDGGSWRRAGRNTRPGGNVFDRTRGSMSSSRATGRGDTRNFRGFASSSARGGPAAFNSRFREEASQGSSRAGPQLQGGDWRFGYVIQIQPLQKCCFVSLEDNAFATQDAAPMQLSAASELGLRVGDRLRYRIGPEGWVEAASHANCYNNNVTRDFEKMCRYLKSTINKVEEDADNSELSLYYVSAGDVGVRFKCEKAKFGCLCPKIGDEVSFVMRDTTLEIRQISDIRLISPTERNREEIQPIIHQLQPDCVTEQRLFELLSVPCAWRAVGGYRDLDADLLSLILAFFVDARRRVSAYQLKSLGDCVLELMNERNFKVDSGVFFEMYRESCRTDCSSEIVSTLRAFTELVVELVKDRCTLVMHVAQPFLAAHFSINEALQLAAKICSNYLPLRVADARWHQLPLVLQMEEMRDSVGEGVHLLPPLRVRSPYRSQEQYFDTCLRLLRADCFEKLRQSVQKFVKNKLHSRDMAVYFRVELRGIEVSYRALSLALHVSPFNRVVKNWAKSPLLMYGNLLCLSFNESFTEIVWLTVSNRDAESLQQDGMILVEVCSDANGITDAELVRRLSCCDGQLWLAESPTYYQAYRYVLSNLQAMTGKQMPLCRELVQCEFDWLELSSREEEFLHVFSTSSGSSEICMHGAMFLSNGAENCTLPTPDSVDWKLLADITEQKKVENAIMSSDYNAVEPGQSKLGLLTNLKRLLDQIEANIIKIGEILLKSEPLKARHSIFTLRNNYATYRSANPKSATLKWLPYPSELTFMLNELRQLKEGKSSADSTDSTDEKELDCEINKQNDRPTADSNSVKTYSREDAQQNESESVKHTQISAQNAAELQNPSEEVQNTPVVSQAKSCSTESGKLWAALCLRGEILEEFAPYLHSSIQEMAKERWTLIKETENLRELDEIDRVFYFCSYTLQFISPEQQIILSDIKKGLQLLESELVKSIPESQTVHSSDNCEAKKSEKDGLASNEEEASSSSDESDEIGIYPSQRSTLFKPSKNKELHIVIERPNPDAADAIAHLKFEYSDLSIPSCKINLKNLEKNILSHLDPSQAKAFKNCIQRRLSVVQGPPGCGKTYVGTHLVRYLTASAKGPLLLLSYKNNALDEFIKKLTQHYGRGMDIIRFGGRSQKQDAVGHLSMKQRQCDAPEEEQIIKAKLRLEQTKDALINMLRQLATLESIEFNEKFLAKYWSAENCDKFARHVWFLGRASNDQVQRQLATAVQQWRPPTAETEAVLLKFQQIHSPIPPANHESAPKPGQQNLETKQKNGEAADNNNEEEDEIDDEKEQQKLERLAVSGGGSGSAMQLSIEFLSSEKPAGAYSLRKSICGFVKEKWKTLRYCSSPWQLPTEERVLFMQGCLLDFVERNWNQAMPQLQAKLLEFSRERDQLRDLLLRRDAKVCSSADVIAMTITGASINNELLKRLKPKTVVVEEAAEIMEPMLLGCLGSWTERLFLIGDHEQLRPSVDNYDLVRHCNLDVSMMERLINNGFPLDQLQMQNRMHPDISKYLRDIYPELKDNMESVGQNELPCFMPRGVTFWDVSHCTDTKFVENGDRSFTNEGEAEIIVELALAFLRFGYKPHQVTILTPYQGQVALIRGKLRKAFSRPELESFHDGDEFDSFLKVYSIDFYQGDENDVVLVSLVRTQHPGFLKSRNRRCVSQSRSRCCLVFVGNVALLRTCPAWSGFLESLDSDEAIHPELPVLCHRHSTQSSWKSVEEIRAGSGSFCFEQCDHLMECGKHRCKRQCHPWHPHVRCNEEVDMTLRCGHTASAVCHFAEIGREPDCNQPCKRTLSCGHRCSLTCCETCSERRCTVDVSLKRSCGHVTAKLCNQPKPLCEEKVTEELKCGHSITNMCHKVRRMKMLNNLRCTEMCERTLSCGHKCGAKCCEPCTSYSCIAAVTSTCVTCEEQFNSVCSFGKQQCESIRLLERACGHKERVPCSMYARTAAAACKKACSQILQCGHECESSCGTQPCPPCRVTAMRPDCEHQCECWEQENDCFSGVRVAFECGHAEDVECCASRRLTSKRYCSKCWMLLRRSGESSAGEIERTILHENDPDTAVEYFKVYDRVMRYMKQEHRLQVKEITSIESIKNPRLAKRLLDAHDLLHKQNCQPELLFHGTSSTAAESIIRDGFKVGSHGMYGAGIYFATDTTKSVQYCRESGTMSLLLCEVLLGKSKICTSPQNHLNLSAVTSESCDSVFAKRNTKGSGGVMNDEYIVYRPEQAAPRYLIKFIAGDR